MKRKIGYVFLSTLVIVVSLFVILSAAIVLFEPAMHAMGTFICPGGDLISQKRTIATTTRSLEDCTSKNYSPEGHCLADSVFYYCRGDMQRRPVLVVIKALAVAHGCLFVIIFLVRFISISLKPVAEPRTDLSSRTYDYAAQMATLKKKLGGKTENEG